MQISLVCHALRSFCSCKFKGHWAMGPKSLCQQWILQGTAHRHRCNPSLSYSSGHRSSHMEAVQSSGSEAKLLGFKPQLCHLAPCATGDLPSPWHLTPSLVEKDFFFDKKLGQSMWVLLRTVPKYSGFVIIRDPRFYISTKQKHGPHGWATVATMLL